MEGGEEMHLLSRLHLVEVEMLLVSADEHLPTTEERCRVHLLRDLEGELICFGCRVVHVDEAISSVEKDTDSYW